MGETTHWPYVNIRRIRAGEAMARVVLPDKPADAATLADGRFRVSVEMAALLFPSGSHVVDRNGTPPRTLALGAAYLGFDDPFSDRVPDQFHPGMQVQFAHDVLAVAFDRLRADHE